ncbi:hypothetical protein GGI15_002409 [Coemansia interrupta]|uniref:Uncharacterized protein n=1 Tax=Coemansia interrupta TaxID=1126814 RepID=A0A9W8HCZ7_9FUNG|nr:hypothetical protein GGI15_002409 [Coemansia interrupta]
MLANLRTRAAALRLIHGMRCVRPHRAVASCRFSTRPPSADKPPVDWDRTLNDALEQAKRELAHSSSSQKPPTPGPPDPPQKPEDYLVTLGRVTEALPGQLEGFLTHGLDAWVYAEHVRFSEPRHSGMQVTGRAQYLGAARVLRIALNAYFAHGEVSVVGVRQQVAGAADAGRKEDDGGGGGGGGRRDGAYDVFVRWVFEGVPRHAELLGNATVSRFEGEFRYALDRTSGLVAEHEVTAIHPAPPTAVLASSGLARWAGWLAPRGMPPVAGST